MAGKCGGAGTLPDSGGWAAGDFMGEREKTGLCVYFGIRMRIMISVGIYIIKYKVG